MSEEAQITYSQGSDVGKVRDHNEDAVLVRDPTDPEELRKGRLFIVADGMGGYQAGEIASQVAVETVQREYYKDPSDDPSERLRNSVQAANQEVQQSAQGNSTRTGMGTTIVVTSVLGRRAYIASVGDSRAYVVHAGQMTQITQDHSFVAEQVRAGILTKEQARVHPQRNVITRALGSQPTIQVDTFVGDLSDGDLLLMCTDGLTGHVPDDRIRETLLRLPPEQAVQHLIQMAKDDGGTDNISVIVIRVGPPPDQTQPTLPTLEASNTPTPPAGTPAVSAADIERARAGGARAVRRGRNLAWVIAGLVLALVVLGVLAFIALSLGVLTFGGFNRATSTPTGTATPVPTVTLLPPSPTPLPTRPSTPGSPGEGQPTRAPGTGEINPVPRTLAWLQPAQASFP